MISNELRLGNFIAYENTCIFCTLETMTKMENKTINCEGIPINNDWLQSFGFDFRDSNYVKHFHNYSTKLILRLESNWSVRMKRNNNLIFLKSIKYVHELQNLYYVLSDEELKYEK